MPASIVIWTRVGGKEPGMRFYLASIAEDGTIQGTAQALASIVAPIVHTSANFTRWAAYDIEDKLVVQGNFPSSFVGLAQGEVIGPKFFNLVRMASSGPKRASVKYVPGATEGQRSNGEATAAYLQALETVGGQWNALNVQDSDGSLIIGAIDRGLTKRNRVGDVP